MIEYQTQVPSKDLNTENGEGRVVVILPEDAPLTGINLIIHVVVTVLLVAGLFCFFWKSRRR